jgi:hypothetical protein|tara:strand:+ start:432 stop:743 length:312 start_codon:yes stop_codon:yes gene_type:complete
VNLFRKYQHWNYLETKTGDRAMINEMNMNELDKVNGGIFGLIFALLGCTKKKEPEETPDPNPTWTGTKTQCKLSGGQHPSCPPDWNNPGCWDGPGGGQGVPSI